MDNAHFSSYEKRSYLILAYTGKHLANYSQKLSIIFKQSKLIPKELRYQEKIHAISDMPRKKQNIGGKKKKKTCNMEMTSYAKQNQT
jgi:hypothetical protein